MKYNYVIYYAHRSSYMYNLFFDGLPLEIQQDIYSIRLSNSLRNVYYHRVEKKIELQKMIMNIPVEHLTNTLFIPGTQHNQIYYDPFDIDVCTVARMALRILTSREFNKDCNAKYWWVTQLIRPIEIGLIIHEYDGGPNSHIYAMTEQLCGKLISKFGIRSLASVS